MGLLVGEKRKNEERRRIPMWVVLLVVGFILGAAFMLAFGPGSAPATVYVSGDSSLTTSNSSDEAIYATATAIIEQATRQAVEAAQP
jgi:hypothetical protein